METLETTTASAEVLEQYYSAIKEAQSDLEFYGTEIQFFDSLINMNLLLKLDERNLNEAQDADRELRKLEKQKEMLKTSASDFVIGIENIINKTSSNNANRLRADFAGLKHQFYLFTEAFRSFKRQLFAETETSLKSEKMKHLLNP